MQLVLSMAIDCVHVSMNFGMLALTDWVTVLSHPMFFLAILLAWQWRNLTQHNKSKQYTHQIP